jgi:hypothetical protein
MGASVRLDSALRAYNILMYSHIVALDGFKPEELR